MPPTWIALGCVTAVVALVANLFVIAYAQIDYSSLYYQFPIHLLNNRLSSLLYLFVAFGLLMFIRHAVHANAEDHSEVKQADTTFYLFVGIFVMFLFLLIFGHAAGPRYKVGIEENCWFENRFEPQCIKFSYATGVGNSLAAFVYFLLLLFFVPALLGVAVATAPVVIEGIAALFTTHPARPPVTRTLSQKRPDHMIERELWTIMDRQDARDAEIERLFGELSPLRRMVLRGQYRKRAREARQLREMTEAKTRVIREETGLARGIHELERSRRAGEDRYGKR